jgi:sugar/nucleoside kinase (ribokinase family)
MALLEILTFGEALVEVMRTEVDHPLDTPSLFEGPYPSGAPFIFTVQAARLGVRAGCIGTVGEDAFGRCLLNQLIQDGVDTRPLRMLHGYTTGVAFVGYKGDGSREFVFHMRHAAAGQLDASLADPLLFEGLKVLHIMGSALAMHADALALGHRLLALAAQFGVPVSFDPNLRRELISLEAAQAAFAPFFDAAQVIFATEEELLALTGSAQAAQGSKRIVVIHQGKDGCTVLEGNTQTQLAAYSVQEVDPTGAGDCFDAGFLAEWIQGRPAPQAAQFANACGALAVTVRGPMSGAQSRDVVEAFMRQHSALS